MKQLIFVIIENKFRSFVSDNAKIFESMEYNEIINITNENKILGHSLCSINMLREPFNITYLGKKTGGEGDFYIFFDYNMDKVYTHYAVE
jgi:hypothetical protein